MGTVDRTVASGDPCMSGTGKVRLMPERRSAVSTACQSAVTALEAFAAVHAEALESNGSERPQAIEAAGAHLDATLRAIRRQPSETLADLREKCRVFRQLDETFELSDPRLRSFILALVWDLADFLEKPHQH